MSPAKIWSLDQLVEVLWNAPTEKNTEQQVEYANEHGLPTAHGEIDWTNLPVFGGDAPADTREVWSWDDTRLLVGTCAEDLELVPRSDVRNQRIEIRVSAVERAQIQMRADAAGMTVSELLRELATGG